MLSFKMLAASGYQDPYGSDWVSRFIEKGLPTALLGMVTVFAVLAIIWGFLEIFRYVFYTLPERNKQGVSPAAKPQSAPAAKIKAPKQSAPVKASDAEIVAAIVAAITAMRADENASDPSAFRVVSFRRR